MIYLLVFLAASVFILIISLLFHNLSKLEIKNLSKRCVFITGCDTGFGNLLARTLDAKGVLVVAGCLTEKGARELKNQTSSRLKTVIVDVTDQSSVKKACEFTCEQTRDIGIWGVVNNAGIMPSYAPAEWTTLEEYERACKVNLFGTISVTLAFLPYLRQSQGRLVNVCSVTSNCGYPGISDYVVSKAGIKMFTSCLRRELLHTGVTAHTIEPGGFKTNITDKHRLFDILYKAYLRAQPDAQKCYGGNISRYLIGGIYNTAKYVSTNPQKVADAMTHALLAKYPNNRYLIGMDAHLFFRMLAALPERISDLIIGWNAPYGPLCQELKEGKMNF
ncbi:retinol dehydrogenase 7-like [Ruditapes philippinarum]|uniref:retinol dehydrogenase 7-like n=1 Tax=Ruditapes philippinarum TaxID=129788 RepID=UPI00295C1A7D|nr:retinol dehydrogenase 7-like [Ruditapes philippinarum]